MEQNVVTQAQQWLENQHPNMLALLEDLVNIDSNSYDKTGVSRVFDRLELFFADFGIKVTSHFVADVRAAISVSVNKAAAAEEQEAVAGKQGAAAGKPVLLMGHCDTVFPTGEVSRRPFRIDGRRAYGPGVADMKAGIVMNAFILAAIAQSGEQTPEVVGLFTCDEEIGSPLSKEVITEFATKVGWVFNAEPGRPSGNVVTGRKGGIFLEMDIEGRAAHSGANFADGISAISELAHKVIALDALTDIDKGVTVNVGLASGGQSVNTSAPSAKASIDLRLSTLDQRESLLNRMQCICNKQFITGALSRMNIIGEFKPFTPTEESRQLFKLYQTQLAAIGHHAEQEFSGGCADSGVTSSLGAITLCATGPVGGKFHTPDEYVEIDSMVPRAIAVYRTLTQLPHTNP